MPVLLTIKRGLFSIYKRVESQDDFCKKSQLSLVKNKTYNFYKKKEFSCVMQFYFFCFYFLL